jgi:predicted nucleic acid-binding protein
VETPLIDTNVFIHAQTTDHRSDECRRFLQAIERGAVSVVLDPLVLHELSYTLRRYRKQITRNEIAQFLISVLRWPGVQGDRDLMIDTVERWSSTDELAFVDAYLGARAAREDRPVYTLNVRDLERQGATVPQPLPEGA